MSFDPTLHAQRQKELAQRRHELHKQQLALFRQMQFWSVPMTEAEQVLYSYEGCEIFVNDKAGSRRCQKKREYFQQSTNGRVPVCALHAIERNLWCPTIIRARL
jgi:hypothetical protein